MGNSETISMTTNFQQKQKSSLIPLSVVVLTKNEEENIEACLKSVKGWVSEIIVIDDESKDSTVEIAGKYADKIFIRKMENEGIHRNWAYVQAKNEWVLSLDADELVSEPLKEEIFSTLESPDAESYSIPIKTYIGDYWVQYSGWYPANKMRLFMKSKQRYEEVEVHPKVAENISCGKLKQDIIHRGYPDFTHLLNSFNRQTTLEARKWIQTARRMSWGRALWRTLDRFPRSFLGKKGYKDGFIGFMVAFFASLYQVVSYVKYLEMKQKIDR